MAFQPAQLVDAALRPVHGAGILLQTVGGGNIAKFHQGQGAAGYSGADGMRACMRLGTLMIMPEALAVWCDAASSSGGGSILHTPRRRSAAIAPAGGRPP